MGFVEGEIPLRMGILLLPLLSGGFEVVKVGGVLGVEIHLEVGYDSDGEPWVMLIPPIYSLGLASKPASLTLMLRGWVSCSL